MDAVGQGGGRGWFEATAAGIAVSVKAVPRSSKAGIDGLYGDEALKVRIKSAPVDGKANKELVGTMADAFGIAKSRVEIVSGGTSKHKRVLLKGLSEEAFRQALPPDVAAR